MADKPKEEGLLTGLGLGKWYTCEACGGTFECGWSAEEARAEMLENWGELPDKEAAVICDGCYQILMVTLREGGNEDANEKDN